MAELFHPQDQHGEHSGDQQRLGRTGRTKHGGVCYTVRLNTEEAPGRESPPDMGPKYHDAVRFARLMLEQFRESLGD